MKIHEYQARELFNKYDIPVNKSFLCSDLAQAQTAFETLGQAVVVKAQVLTGGRGKAGGVKLAQNASDLQKHAQSILGMDIKGYIADKILVASAVDITAEYYLSFAIDRNTKSTLLMVCPEGGVDIETLAHEKPESIHRFEIDNTLGIPDFLARRAAFCLFDDINLVKQAASIIQKLYRLFVETDASIAEINPLVKTSNGEILAIDAKMNFDDNALYRQPELVAIRQPTPDEEKELYAKSRGFSYVRLDGNIGCMVNGAGLAMGTMDMIKLFGGEPANFLDIGGSSNPNKVIDAMKLLLEDSQVKAVLINIFGGITRCDDVATGLIRAFDLLTTDIPVVVRLTGTNEKEGRELLQGKRFHIAETMEDATRMAITFGSKS